MEQSAEPRVVVLLTQRLEKEGRGMVCMCVRVRVCESVCVRESESEYVCESECVCVLKCQVELANTATNSLKGLCIYMYVHVYTCMVYTYICIYVRGTM